MKFTKTAVALAVAGIVAAPMTASATTTLSGVVQIKINGSDAEGDAGDPAINSGDVQIGIATEHTLNNGLTGYGSVRSDLDSLSGGAGDSADNVYVGMKGGFGDLRFGEIGVAAEYGQLSNDIFDQTGAINAGIGYTGSFGPASIGLSYSPAQSDDVIGAGIKFNVGGFTVGLGAEDRDEKANMSAGVSFAYAGASIGAHFATKETSVDAVAAVPADAVNFVPAVAAVEGSETDTEIVGVKVGYGIGAVSLGLTFMTQSAETTAAGVTGDAVDDEVVRLDIGYDLGGSMNLSTRINNFSGDSGDSSDWRIQLSKSF